MIKTLWILGTSGHAREMAAVAHATDPSSMRWNKIRLISQSEEVLITEDNAELLLGMGSPNLRRSVMTVDRPGAVWPILVHPHSHVGPNVNLDKGVVIAPAAAITADVQIGQGSMINTGAVISHDAVIGKFCLINPRAAVSGNAVVEDEVLIGAGAVVLEGRRIGEGAVVGAGAVVTKDVAPGTTVVGVPAGIIERLRSAP